jgi:hypothetical protein
MFDSANLERIPAHLPTMSHHLPPDIQQCLQSLQRRMLAVRIFSGIGLLLLSLCAIIGLSFCLDYLLQPPLAVRVLHSLLTVSLSLYLAYRWLLTPLLHRPSAAQLAAIIEKNYPLDDRLSSSVELAAQHEITEGSFLSSLMDQAVADCQQLRPQKIYPMSSPLYKFCCALLASGALLLCASYFPQHNNIFWQRIFGSDIAWPAKTQLVFIVDSLDSANNFLSTTSPNHFVLHTSDPGNLSLQVRSIGDLPPRVLLHGLSQSVSMTPLGGGDFIYSLPPLLSSTTFSISGGDHLRQSSSLEVVVGAAPMLSAWQVAVVAPEYTLLRAEESNAQELRVIAGSLIKFSFSTNDNVTEVKVVDANDKLLSIKHDKGYHGEITPTESNELTITIINEDDFTSYYPNQLSWQLYNDLAPQIEVLFPQRNFYAVVGGILPLSLQLSDDFSLSELQLVDQNEQKLVQENVNGLLAKRFITLNVDDLNYEADGGNSNHFEVIVGDNRQPTSNTATLQTVNYYLQSIEEAESHLSQEVQALRRRLDNLRDRLDVFAQLNKPASSFEIRRVLDSIDTTLEHSEWLLCERVFSKLDSNSDDALLTLQELLSNNRSNGAVVDEFAKQNSSTLAGRSRNLWQLANALMIARDYPAADLLKAFEDGNDLELPFSQLRDEIDGILESIVSWEDYQSAVNLLRQLLDRQRGLYLRTQEAVL